MNLCIVCELTVRPHQPNKRCCAMAVKDGSIVRATLALVKLTTVKQSIWINQLIGAVIRAKSQLHS